MLKASTGDDVPELVPMSLTGAACSASPELALTLAGCALAFLPFVAC